MQSAEQARMDAVRRYDILDTPPDGAFDRVVAMVAQLLSVPISLVSVVDDDRIWFKARHGLDVRQIERLPGLCASAILQDGPWLVADAAHDIRTIDNPLVAGELGLRFYAGVPLVTRDGHKLGTLCAIDQQPREITPTEVSILEGMASLVVDQLELRLSSRVAVLEKNAALELAQQASKQSQLLTAMVQSSQDAIVTKDLGSIVTSWNEAAQRLFGYSEQEMIGTSIRRIIPVDRAGEEDFVLGSVTKGERVEHYETLRRHKDGHLIPISITVSPIWDDAGRVIGASKIARDITDRKVKEQRINSLMREVNHRVKNQYAVILSMLRQTSRTTTTLAEFEESIRERIMALSRSHDLLVDQDWQGTTIADLIAVQIDPFSQKGRASLAGPSILLSPAASQYLGMAFYELAANSAAHGSMSGHGGKVKIVWSIQDLEAGRWLHLEWIEEDGPEVTDVAESGFGPLVLRRIAPEAVSGKGTIETGPGHLKWILDAPLVGITGSESLLKSGL